MAKSAIDANVKSEIFRKDFPQILATRRDLAQILSARLKDISADYLAGTVLVRNSSTGQYEKYSASSGSYDAVGVLFENVLAEQNSATAGALARVIVKGTVYKDKLIGYDSGAKSDLLAKEITDASSTNLVIF